MDFVDDTNNLYIAILHNDVKQVQQIFNDSPLCKFDDVLEECLRIACDNDNCELVEFFITQYSNHINLHIEYLHNANLHNCIAELSEHIINTIGPIITSSIQQRRSYVLIRTLINWHVHFIINVFNDKLNVEDRIDTYALNKFLEISIMAEMPNVSALLIQLGAVCEYVISKTALRGIMNELNINTINKLSQKPTLLNEEMDCDVINTRTIIDIINDRNNIISQIKRTMSDLKADVHGQQEHDVTTIIEQYVEY